MMLALSNRLMLALAFFRAGMQYMPPPGSCIAVLAALCFVAVSLAPT